MKKPAYIVLAGVFMLAFAGFGLSANGGQVYAQNGDNCPDRVKKLARGTGFRLGGEGSCPGAGPANRLENTIATIVDIITVIIGIVAVIMIIYGGFRYITSGGDSNSITAAKHTIIYAIVGLIIVALAQVIVRFVLSQAG